MLTQHRQDDLGLTVRDENTSLFGLLVDDPS